MPVNWNGRVAIREASVGGQEVISNLSIYRQSGLIEQRNETRLLPFQDASRDTELTGVLPY